MTPDNNNLSELQETLRRIQLKQQALMNEINALRLKIDQVSQQAVTESRAAAQNQAEPAPKAVVKASIESMNPTRSETESAAVLKPAVPVRFDIPGSKSNLEKWVGENLINKIGIIITVLGVSIGAKYSIDNNLISPAMRILSGYAFGFGLLAFAWKLKNKYESFSAVLVSGAMAILYFITFLAYELYHFLPKVAAFAMMFVFTVFTVIAAIRYNRQVIAHIGLVGAYAVPFLLSDGTGNVTVLFTYMVILNIGILATAFARYWKPLNYVAFGITWLIYIAWFDGVYNSSLDLFTSLLFASIFFAIFYITFLAYKLKKKELFGLEDLILLLCNSFIIYGIGYAALARDEATRIGPGIFTLANALVHFIATLVIRSKKLADGNVARFTTGLALLFITIAVPVQLDGNWVTLLWTGEAALLFWIGRATAARFYEKLAYPLMILAFFAIADDWAFGYERGYFGSTNRLTPLINKYFLTSLLFIAAFAFINRVNQKFALNDDVSARTRKIINAFLPTILLVSIYFTFHVEIVNYFDQLILKSIPAAGSGQAVTHSKQYQDLEGLKSVWLINYALLFFSILGIVNIRKVRSGKLALINLALLVLGLFIFLTSGLHELGLLRERYIHESTVMHDQAGVPHKSIRYISYAFIALALWTWLRYKQSDLVARNFDIVFDFVLYTVILCVCSSELIHLMRLAGSPGADKIGLSILWGIYSLFLIVMGIWKKRKHLRIGAIALFAGTLAKVFLYDIADLNTIAKTIVFVSLGILLLIISFLYNKYKGLITEGT